jgi:phage tail sheath protein FI
MAPDISTGISIPETPSITHSITGVPTSVAFLGTAAQGPTDQAILVTSWADFQNQFGGFDPSSYLGYAISHFFANAGQQAYVVRLTDSNDGNAAAKSEQIKTGLQALDAVPAANLLVVPGETDPATIAQLQAYCAGRRAFLIVDSAADATVAKLQNGPDSLMTGANASNSAFYFPWIDAFDAQQQNLIRPFPPSGFIAGLYAATDSDAGVWKAAAGTGRPLAGTVESAPGLTEAEVDGLIVHAVNCIRFFPTIGTVVWGARTLAGGAPSVSEWQYVTVRRLALYIESSISAGIQWAAFEPNDSRLWAQLTLSVNTFMEALFRQGAFQGSVPSATYFVKCDATTNPPSSVAQGVVTIQVGFAPVRPAEFVVIQIQQKTAQSGNSS